MTCAENVMKWPKLGRYSREVAFCIRTGTLDAQCGEFEVGNACYTGRHHHTNENHIDTCFSGHINDVTADGGTSTSRSLFSHCGLLPQMRSNAQNVKSSLHCLLTIRMRLVASLTVEKVNGHAQVVRRIQKSRIGIVTLSLDRPP